LVLNVRRAKQAWRLRLM